MGTVPLMFGIGAMSSVLSRKFTLRVMKAGAVAGLGRKGEAWGFFGISGEIYQNPCTNFPKILHFYHA
jgi:hypothetical protein